MAKNKHDLSFKSLMGNKEFFIAACKVYLPKDLVKRIDWDNVELYKMEGQQITESSEMSALGEARADIIYRFKIDETKSGLFIVAFEHQSTPDKIMPLRCASYNCRALLDYVDDYGLGEGLPVVINFVYYHGKISPYPYSMDLGDLFNDKAFALQHFLKPKLIDVGQLSNEEIAQHGEIAPAEFLFKQALNQSEFGQKQVKTFVHLVKISYNLGEQLPPVVIRMLKYGLEISDLDDKVFIEEVLKALPEYEDDIMTAADQLRQQGMQQGMQQGIQQGLQQAAMKMLKKGAGVDYVHDILGLPKSEVEVIMKDLKKHDN